MTSLEKIPELGNASNSTELARVVFSDPELTDKEYIAGLLNLAQDRVEIVNCSSCASNQQNLLEATKRYQLGELKLHGSIRLQDALNYYGAKRICAEELYLHFYGADDES